MLKRLFYRLMLLTLVGMLVAPFILKKENGAPIMSMEEFLDFNPNLIKERYSQVVTLISSFLPKKIKVEDLEIEPREEKITKLYKWKDENGEWHFSDVKSEEYQQEEIQIYNDRNVLKFEDLPEKDKESDSSMMKEKEKEKITDDAEQEDGAVTGYINKMKTTMQKAQDVQGQIDDNYQRKVDAIENKY